MKQLWNKFLCASLLIQLFTHGSISAQISIGLKGCYGLQNNESQATPSSTDVDQYNKLKAEGVESYINKLVVSADSKKFFSFVLSDLTLDVCKKIEKDAKFKIVEKSFLKTDSTTYNFYKIIVSTGAKINKIVFKQPRFSNSLMVDVVFKEEAEWSSFYKKREDFIKKLRCANK